MSDPTTAMSTTTPSRLTAAEVTERLGLAPLEVEGGLFRRTWASTELVTGTGRPVGTAIYALFSDDPDSFSALHALDADEVWHHYLGDTLLVHLFGPAGSHDVVRLGPDLLAGELPQLVIPAGVVMGAHVVDGGSYALIGCTMAPGFVSASYLGADRELMLAACCDAAARSAVIRLTRPGEPLSRPQEA